MSNTANDMTALDIARRLLDLGQTQDACRAYELALQTQAGLSPSDKLECAVAVLQLEGNYRPAYLALRELYNAGEFRADVLDILTQAFYLPNVTRLKNQYEKTAKS